MTPADELRAAAEKLRTLAAAATPGPWHVHLPNGYPQGIYSEESDDDLFAEVLDEIDQPKPNAPYIAAMHPGVGTPLADWLDSAAVDAEQIGCDYRATNVARAILGQP
jgi:hypothetical protein